jgi:dTDP-glucose 4,6-dehydratase
VIAVSTDRAVVTGGAGFLGSHFVRRWLERGGRNALTLDALTYAGQGAGIADLGSADRHRFVQADIADPLAVAEAFQSFRPTLVVHFAAESHVTRGESERERTRLTNVEGTRVVFEAAERAGASRIVHVSTDEVYGPCAAGAFREEDKAPGEGRATSTYARSKALADDIARTWRDRLDVVVVRPTNCFGAWQHPEKAFARWVVRALQGRTLPVWGDGRYVRQWLAVEDLARAIELLAGLPNPDPVYNIGPRHDPEITNVDLAAWIARYLDLPPDRVVLTAYDRPGHDRRYAVDPSRIEALGWRAGDVWKQFADTVDWYRANRMWWERLVDAAESLYKEDVPSEAAR